MSSLIEPVKNLHLMVGDLPRYIIIVVTQLEEYCKISNQLSPLVKSRTAREKDLYVLSACRKDSSLLQKCSLFRGWRQRKYLGESNGDNQAVVRWKDGLL